MEEETIFDNEKENDAGDFDDEDWESDEDD
jgi:hypothetical protein